MPYSVEGKLVVAISSRALFDFEEENRIFERDGEPAYIALQFARLDVPARHGVAFPLVKKLLAFNAGGRAASRWWCCRRTTRCPGCACSSRPSRPGSPSSAAFSRAAAIPTSTSGP